MKQVFLLLILSITLFSSCDKDNDPSMQLATDIDMIEEWLQERGLTAQRTESGLHYIIEEEGIGDEFPTANSTVRCFYKGYLTCNRVFDQSNSVEPSEFGLNSVIEGWTEGIPLFKKGGKGKLLIPSELGYGPAGTFGIPGNTVLIFDIELVSFF